VSTRAKVTIAVVSAGILVAAATAYLKLGAGDEDRPPIIVRSGSVTIEGGDPLDAQHWKKWVSAGDKRHYNPDHNNGAKVKYFAVQIANADNSAQSPACPALPVLGTVVSVEYTLTNGNSPVGVVHVSKDINDAPLVDLPTEVSPMDGSGSTPPRLTYDPGAGWISQVSVSLPNGLGTVSQSCRFAKPASGPGSAVITIQPLR
jgi:hypothetical protein